MCAAQTKKPSAGKSVATQVNSAVVLGTTQIPGDFGKFGQTYTVGKSDPINFTLKSADQIRIHDRPPLRAAYRWSMAHFDVRPAASAGPVLPQPVVGRELDDRAE